MNKIIFITGATSGIGKASAEKFAKEGFKLIITGRRLERLEQLSNDLKTEFGTESYILNFDVRDRDEVEKSINSLPTEWRNIDILLNNAGLAVGLNTIQDGIIDDWERMIDTNVKGLLYVSRAILPLMVERKKGHVINIGSIAGKETYPFGNVYCASKHAVDSLTKAMRIDMVQYGIKVTQIAPGAIETEFSNVRFKGDDERAKNVYKGFNPMIAQDVADVIFYSTTLPEHVNINDLVLMPTAQASATVFHKVL
jgi:3-hydroxy acid dehydrogenase/malonic semialdehyde reductase